MGDPNDSTWKPQDGEAVLSGNFTQTHGSLEARAPERPASP